MSITAIQQDLVSLLLGAKKSLSQGRDISTQANLYQQSSKKYVETIERVHPKLLFIDSHISLQIKDLESMKFYLDAQTESCKSRIKDRETKLQSLTIELTNIFNLLKECKVDKDILKVNKERGGKSLNEETLFDYISDQEIIELQSLADDEIVRLETIHNSLLNQTKNMSNIIKELQISREKASIISINDSIFSFAHEKIQLQEKETQTMAEILFSLLGHYDQVQETTKTSQSDPEKCEQFDISVLKADDDQLPSIIENLKNILDNVISISEEIEDRMEIYLNVKKELSKVLNQLDQFGLNVDTIYDKLLDAESEIKERENNLDNFFDQLKSLADWYRCYSSSYNYLLLEIDRRKNAQEKQNQLKNDLLKSFEITYNDELQERKSWSAQHGHYLPEALCPFINDPPSILTVTLENNEVTRLPNLSRSGVEKALSEIHNDHN